MRLTKRLLYAILFYTWVEFLSFILLAGIAKRYPTAVFTPPKQISKDLQRNLADPIGWGSEYIQTSSNNSFLGKEGCRIHLFGDSFMEANTYKYISRKDGTKSTPEDLLSELTDCAVYNHGVGGYGSDQSFLKFVYRTKDSTIRKGDFVVLSHLTENILRNANRNRSLISPNGSSPLLKPRYKIVKNELRLIPIPNTIEAAVLKQLKTYNYPKLLQDGENPLFIPGATLGSPALVSYPYSVNIARALTNSHVLSKLTNEASHVRYYHADTESYRVTLKIIRSFHEICTEIGCHSLSIDLPMAKDFGRYFVNGKNSFPLANDLKDYGLFHVSIGELQSKAYPQLRTNKCFLHDGSYDGGDSCNAHYNQEGQRSFFEELAILLNRES